MLLIQEENYFKFHCGVVGKLSITVSSCVIARQRRWLLQRRRHVISKKIFRGIFLKGRIFHEK